MRHSYESSCRVLGVKPGASASEIKAAYRDLVKAWHPDRFAYDARLQARAQEGLKRINSAFAFLKSSDFSPPSYQRHGARRTEQPEPSTSDPSPPPSARNSTATPTGSHLVSWALILLIVALVRIAGTAIHTSNRQQARLATAAPEVPPEPGWKALAFTRGSSTDEVLRVQGRPDDIEVHVASGYEIWHYGESTVRISTRTDEVTEWDDNGDLEVRLPPAN